MRTSVFSLLATFLVPLSLLGACGEDSPQPPPGDSSGVAGSSGAAGSGQAGAAGSGNAGASGVSGQAGSSGTSGQSGEAGSAGSGAGEGGQGGASGSGGQAQAGDGGTGGAEQGGAGAGTAGEAGAGGDAGAAGEAGAGAAGAAGESGGAAGSSGASGQSGEAGAGGSESGGSSGGAGQGGTESGGQAGAGGSGEPFTLASSAFTEGGTIPTTPYACSNKSYGTGTSPPLSWTGVPAGTQSFALLVDDPTAGGWVHWVVFNLPASETGLSEGNVPAGVTLGGADGAAPGDGGLGPQYAGPCPPSGVHTYSFRLYALDVASLAGVSSGATKAQVSAAMAGHVLATSELKGKVASSSL